ncbi:hypothetical protein CAXC1_350017 [Candidatus Xenohaliotis californiensis]|uniref:Uncharacterized protein n=1 Tax=Candidatus Xenohaliotis californiensis TaxID=84677 RepID=A0ABM9N905_9RICK|nr:hypothetical protein CAXC1_350017 [Candidatus Xenohaliotis californiensis]
MIGVFIACFVYRYRKNKRTENAHNAQESLGQKEEEIDMQYLEACENDIENNILFDAENYRRFREPSPTNSFSRT